MNYEYSKIMKRMMKKQPSTIIQILLILAIIFFAGVGVNTYITEKANINQRKEDAVTFSRINSFPIYSKITPELLSEEFAANFDDSIYYCIAVDKDSNPYIVAIKAEDMDQYQELIEYTYQDVSSIPPAVELKGIPVEIDDELVAFAVEAYNMFWGSEVVEVSNFNIVFGSYFLDTTQKPELNTGTLTMFLLLAILAGAYYVYLIMSAKKSSKRRQATLDSFQNNKILEIDQELNQSTTVYYKPQKLYFTSNYIVSTARGFDMIPFAEITHVYGYTYGNNKWGTKNSIMVTTKDNVTHEIAVIKIDDVGSALYNQIVDQMQQRLPEIDFGFENNFYTASEQKDSIEVDTVEGVDGVKSNVVLGIIGAIIGAALGGIIWIIIGKLGFIAGIAGFAMMLFAIKGYRKLAGSLDKKGQIISLIIAFVMIFIANYAQYVLEFCKYYYSNDYSMTTIIKVFKELPDLLTMADVWGDFAKDLVIGYALSIWAGFKIIKTTFSSSK